MSQSNTDETESDDGIVVTVPAGAAFRAVHTKQEQANWCWASCAEMVLRALGLEARSQCQIASGALGRDCCTEPQPCNQPLAMTAIEPLYEQLGVRSIGREGELSADEVMAEILEERPVQIGLTYPQETVGHVVLAIGETNTSGGRKLLRIADPIGRRRNVDPGNPKSWFLGARWSWTWSRMTRMESGK